MARAKAKRDVPAVKAKAKAKRDVPAVKAKAKAKRDSPEAKAKRNSPEAIAKRTAKRIAELEERIARIFDPEMRDEVRGRDYYTELAYEEVCVVKRSELGGLTLFEVSGLAKLDLPEFNF